MVTIDGSYGEGGGQILRTSLTLSALTGKPLRIFNIRAKRRNPGLRPQHLMSARAVSQVCGGTLEGAEVGSQTLVFHPGGIRGGDFTLDIGSAGSTGMVFQTILPVLIFADKPSTVIIKGGTHTSWSPPIHYIRDVFLPEVGRMGVTAHITLERWGFYPRGGGMIKARIEPLKGTIRPVDLRERGRPLSVEILSTVANLPRSIGERQLRRAMERLGAAGIRAEGRVEEVVAASRGTFLFILASFEKVRAGFSSLGERGKPAERVADEAVDDLLSYLASGAALDPHLSDQISLYAALGDGVSTFTTSRITGHLLTNLWVIERFLPLSLSVSGREGERGEVKVEGIALKRHAQTPFQ